MENSIYIGLSRQLALETDMQIVSNNIANMNTTGFRAQNTLFREYIVDPDGQKDPLSFVVDYGQYDSTKPGPAQQTGGPLDLALQGPGFFGVTTNEGTQYTRGGNFAINANGELVTPSGHTVASANGGTITIPEDATEIKITENGTISSQQGEIGQIMIVEFDDPQSITPKGNGLYASDEQGTPATETRAIQGMLEGSNVEPVLEMTRMINIHRNYQAMQRMLQSEHERQRTAIKQLMKQG